MLLGQAPSNESASAHVRGYAFGRFRLDLNRSELLRDGRPLSLRPKAFDVLLQLVRRAGRVVSRAELFECVWPGLVVTDDSLTQCLIDIRKALGDDGREMIRTVPRRGYLFAVEVVDHAEPCGGSNPEAECVSEGRRSLSGWRAAAAYSLLAVAVGAAWWRMGLESAPAANPGMTLQPPPASVATQPFVAGADSAGDRDPRARQHYLRGRLFYSRRATGDIMRAHHSFEKAVEIDPAFADAWVSLAATINVRKSDGNLADHERLDAEFALPLMREALEKALALEPRNPEALWRMARLNRRAGSPLVTGPPPPLHSATATERRLADVLDNPDIAQ